MASTFATGSLFGDIGHTFEHVAHDVGHGLEKAAEGTFNAASKVATTLARPVFDITRDAAAAGASLIAHVPFVSESERKKIEAASRTIMRARLGDVNAQQFVHAIGEAAKAGVKAAREAGDALLEGTKIVGHVLDAPMLLIEKVPVVGGVLHSLDPFVKMDHMTTALQRGDFKALKTMIENDVKMAQGVVSLIPGIGTGISAAIGAGIGVLDGGGALDIAIETAYGAIPIPPGIREVTDAVVAGVLRLVHNPKSITDAVLAGARNAIPAGIPRDVFDTLVKLVIHRMPIAHVAEDLVGTYVKRYGADLPISAAVAEASSRVPTVVHVGGNAGVALDFAAKQLGRNGVRGQAASPLSFVGEITKPLSPAPRQLGPALPSVGTGIALRSGAANGARGSAPNAIVSTGLTLALPANLAAPVTLEPGASQSALGSALPEVFES